MNSLRVLIVDDEPGIRRGIRRILSAMPAVEVVGECECAADAVAAIRAGNLDLVLLDICLPDGTGIDIVREVGPAAMPAVIFVTAYDAHAVEAFELNAVDYLLKPFNERRIKASIERARQRLSVPSDLVQRLEALVGDRETKWLKRLVVRTGERFDFVPADAVDWIESANNYTVLHTRSAHHVYSETLTWLEQHLDPARFSRVHRCRIVNVSRIVSANAMSGGAFELVLRDGTTLGTGRQYAEAVRKLLRPDR